MNLGNKSKKEKGYLQGVEIESALTLVTKIIQMQVFKD